MLERLDTPEGKSPEAVRRSFDNELGTASWLTPGRQVDPGNGKDPGAPDWWVNEEDASQSFLNSMGVVFPNG